MKGWPGEPDMEYDVLMADGEAAANAGKPITDVIFDFGNVLIYWDPAAVMTPRYDDELVERFLDNDISGFYDINNLLDGGMSNDEGVALMRKTSGDQWADMLQYYLDNFVDSLTGVVPGARVLINDLKAAGIGVWGLSNWQKDLFPIALEHYDILQMLNDRVVSGYVELRKPHKGACVGPVRHQCRRRDVRGRQGDEYRRGERGRHSWCAIQGFACPAQVADRQRRRYSRRTAGVTFAIVAASIPRRR